MDRSELRNRFVYHPPTGPDQTQRYEQLRAAALVLAETVDALCPDSREKSVAITNIETAVMFANAAIARNE